MVAKPIPAKLNPAHDAAVRRMLATPPQPKKPVKKVVTKRSERQGYRFFSSQALMLQRVTGKNIATARTSTPATALVHRVDLHRREIHV